MRHALGWADLTGKTVGIFGAGIEGRAAIERLDGLAREIVVVDDAPSPSGDPTVWATDKGGLDALERCDVVIKSLGSLPIDLRSPHSRLEGSRSLAASA